MTAPNFLFWTVARIGGAARPAGPAYGRTLPSAGPMVHRIRDDQWEPFYGTKRIAGTVKVITAPAPNRVVRLYDRESGKLAFETISAIDGTYSFPAVFAGRQFYAIALDAQPGGYNATIEDLVTPA